MSQICPKPLMATYEKRGHRTRAKIRLKGVQRSKTFVTKAAARKWAARVEAEILDGKVVGTNSRHTLADAAKEWAKNVAPTHRGSRPDIIRANRLVRDLIGSVQLRDLNSDVVEEWRDRRLEVVKPGSVLREWNTLSSIVTYARDKLGWMDGHPFRSAERPPKPRPRERRVSQDEIERVCLALGFDGEVKNKSHEVAVGFLLAIETAMRLGEICSLRSRDLIALEERYVVLERTKNNDPRKVPLSTEAVRLLRLLPGGVFTVSASSASALFRKAKLRAGLDDLTFHDTRHEALTRLASKFSIMELARVVGHRDTRSLMIYFNPTVSELAARLD